MPLSFRHLTSSAQLERADMDVLFGKAEEMEGVIKKGGDDRLRGKILASLFFQPSTRTRLSFEVAMQRLGGQIITADGLQFSSLYKGESLEDTIRVISGYVDAICMRHPDDGSAARAAPHSVVPFINAGDGQNQHPTQAFLDAYTIKKETGRTEDLKIAMVGDLKNGRTVHSLCQLMSLKMQRSFTFVSPEVLRMPEEIKGRLRAARIPFEESDGIDAALDADVIYMTRIQKEAFEKIPDGLAEYERVKDCCILKADHVRGRKATVMHPLPRVNEIETSVDALPNAAYFRQAENGVPVRMALLDLMVNEGRAA